MPNVDVVPLYGGLDRVEQDGWVVLSAGDAPVATWVTTVNGVDAPVALAVLSAASAAPAASAEEAATADEAAAA